MAETLTVPVTNIGYNIWLSDFGTQPTKDNFLGDIKTADGLEYQANSFKYAPVNKGGYARSVPTLKEGQPATFEIYMNDNYMLLHEKFHNNDVSSTDFYCSLGVIYPKNEVNQNVPNFYYYGYISKIKQSGGTEAEAQYFTFEFTPTSEPMAIVEGETGEETNTEA